MEYSHSAVKEGWSHASGFLMLLEAMFNTDTDAASNAGNPKTQKLGWVVKVKAKVKQCNYFDQPQEKKLLLIGSMRYMLSLSYQIQ